MEISMTELESPLFSVEDVLKLAADIYEKQRGKNRKGVLKILIDTYYSKLENLSSQKVIFTESHHICETCIGVRLLQVESESQLEGEKSYKCPVCRKWFSESDLHTSRKEAPDKEPIRIWGKDECPDRLRCLFTEGDSWIMIAPYPYQGKLPVDGREYGVTPDGRIGMKLGDEFKIVADISATDLFGYLIRVF